MKKLALIIFFLSTNQIFGQEKALTYTNNTNSYHNKENLTKFNEPTINDITIHPNGSFEFHSRPETSCLLWKSYKGKWKKENNTISFFDEYDLMEKNILFHFNRNTEDTFTIKFYTDKKSKLKNKEVLIEYVYDFESHLKDAEKTYTLNEDNIIKIPYQDIPNLEKLASLRIAYHLNNNNNNLRYDGYITENEMVNQKFGSIPNLVEVEFIENPKKETIHRTTKGILKDNTLLIISTIKTKTKLNDFRKTLNFEKVYTLNQQ